MIKAIRNSAEFRQSIGEYEADLRERTNQPLYRPFVEQREALAQAVDGLDLTPAEWRTLRWFLDWDNTADLASIIAKARATDMSVASVTL
ncbi:hypothetical protein [Nocardioides pyridinolyticus]